MEKAHEDKLYLFYLEACAAAAQGRQYKVESEILGPALATAVAFMIALGTQHGKTNARPWPIGDVLSQLRKTTSE